MSTKVKVVIVVALVAGAFAGGRYLTPVKIKTEIKTVEVVKTVIVKDKTSDKEVHKTTTTIDSVKPDGTKTTTTTVVEDSSTKQDTKTDIVKDGTKTETTKKEVTKTSSRLNISALGGAPISIHGLETPVFGLHVSKDILGPVSVGIWGLTDKTFGLSVGLTF